ncbi:DUF3656 domain-containing U32 family peptidase [Garciella nitratireducens]|uniref:Putative protease n=1 Tax=Garciella nitratireducens DSM 15102 TaxID=1121911 RepID=A0A1T4K3C5_9FIRM|nr:U32 family peptidase [Garciella nitratireducens]SJZ36825.1 putative protease [Garciella nitratireducens DSM 15102]
MEKIKKPELLSPVGSMEALIAAVENGADAVYLGGKSYSARQYASNFDNQELKQAVEYCHLQNVKLYVTINTLLKEQELKEIFEYILFLYGIGVDALIIQDLGLLKILQKILPEFPIQSSTQMTIHSLEGVKLLEKEGFYRVVLARELSLKEIKYIVDRSNIEIKIFNHGALCISYSGQCLMSSIIGGRSGNRGRCAQPCRKRYTLVDLKNQVDLSKFNGFLLSPKDLNTIEQIQYLIDSGAQSFKIEGRMKRPEYVAIVTALYRKAIDQYVEEQKIDITQKDVKELTQIFNRGFTTAYFFSNPGKDFISREKPNNRGILLGTIQSIHQKSKKMDVLLQESLQKGDGIEVWNMGRANTGMIIPYIQVNGKNVERASAGKKIAIPLLKNVRVGNKVYKTSDSFLLKKAQDTFRTQYQRKQKIYGSIFIFKGQPLKLSIWDENNHKISVIGEKLVEKARKRPLDRDRIIKQLEKLGGTPFVLEGMEVNMDVDATIALKEINAIRRKAVEKLKQKILKKNRFIEIKEKKKIFQDLWNENDQKKTIKPILSAKVGTLEAVKALSKTDITEIIFGGDIRFNIDLYRRALILAKENQKRIIFAFPRISRQNYILLLQEKKKELLNLSPDGLLLSNLELVHVFQDVSIEKEGDFTLNVLNHLAVEKLYEMGLDSICISPELRLKEIQEIKKYTNVPLNLFIHGDIEMMLSEYCPISCKDRKEECISCENTLKYALKDEKGMIFPLYIDDFGRSHILNSKKLCLLENLPNILKIGFKKLRFQFLVEEKEEIIETVSTYKKFLNFFFNKENKMPKDVEKVFLKWKKQGFTKGHYFRGVL